MPPCHWTILFGKNNSVSVKNAGSDSRDKKTARRRQSWRRVFSGNYIATNAMKKAATTMLPETASAMLKVVRAAFSE
ncbi:MAG: hypothetical protein ACI9HY_000008 [Planctomycetaceae bacterium]|jgi:hypothetical protein